MVPRCLALLVAGLAFAAAGCGSSRRADCEVKIYFHTGVPRSAAIRLARELRADDRVAAIDLVTADEALRRMKKKFPDLVQRLPSNPLPDALEVRPKRIGDAAAIVARLRPVPPAVDAVKYGGAAC